MTTPPHLEGDAPRFPGQPAERVLVEQLSRVVQEPHAINGYVRPLAQALGGRTEVSPREIAIAMISAREGYIASLGEAGPMLRRVMELTEQNVVDVLAPDEALGAGVRMGLMLDSFDRLPKAEQESIKDSFRADRPSAGPEPSGPVL